jgi:hypothetical protein
MNLFTYRMARLGFVLMLCFAFGSIPRVDAQSDPTVITIHLSQCPAGYTGSDPFTDCHSNGVAGVTFTWRVSAPGPATTSTTDADGVTSFETLGAANGIKVTEQPPIDLASYSVYCSMNDGADTVPFNYVSGEVAVFFVDLTLGGGEQVICDWYNVPAGTSDSGNSGGVTVLPNTGAGTPSGGNGWLTVLLAIPAVLAAGVALQRRLALAKGVGR